MPSALELELALGIALVGALSPCIELVSAGPSTLGQPTSTRWLLLSLELRWGRAPRRSEAPHAAEAGAGECCQRWSWSWSWSWSWELF